MHKDLVEVSKLFKEVRSILGLSQDEFARTIDEVVVQYLENQRDVPLSVNGLHLGFALVNTAVIGQLLALSGFDKCL